MVSGRGLASSLPLRPASILLLHELKLHKPNRLNRSRLQKSFQKLEARFIDTT